MTEMLRSLLSAIGAVTITRLAYWFFHFKPSDHFSTGIAILIDLVIFTFAYALSFFIVSMFFKKKSPTNA